MSRLGATPHADGSCTFEVWAPHAGMVEVEILGGDGADAGTPGRVELTAHEHGTFRATLPNVRAGARYGLRLDGEVDGPLLPDPASRLQPEGVHGPSQVVDVHAFAWTDAEWTGLPLADHVLYELHVGTFTPEGTFAAAAERLPELAELGITAIELMPIAEFPGARNWGYDGVDLFAAHHAYGGIAGLQAFVDRAHAEGLAVVLDVVYNHFGPEGNYLGKFGPYVTDTHHTPWGNGVNVDGAGSDHVRRFFIQNALHWLVDCHVDGLRLDAVHGIVDTSATPFLAELGDVVAATAGQLGRDLHLISESDLNDARVVSSRAVGGWGHDAQWLDDFHHPLHVALTGETSSYYADFTGGVADLATSLRQGFVYTGQYSVRRDRRHGNDGSALWGCRFVAYAQNHDQVGNRKHGNRLSTQATPAQQRLALAATLLSPFLPMLFMGEEYGETAPFPYFISHGDPALVKAVQQGRAREFPPTADGRSAPDPASEATFASAVLDWGLAERGEHLRTREFVRELLRVRREHASLHAGQRPADTWVHELGASALAVERIAGGDRTLLVLNFADDELDLAAAFAAPDALADARSGAPAPEPAEGWTTIVTTDAPHERPGRIVDPFGVLLLAVPHSEEDR